MNSHLLQQNFNECVFGLRTVYQPLLSEEKFDFSCYLNYPNFSSLSFHQQPKPTVISSTSNTATWSSWRLREACHFIQSEWSTCNPQLPTSQRSRASSKMDRSPGALNPTCPIPQWPTAPIPSQTPACWGAGRLQRLQADAKPTALGRCARWSRLISYTLPAVTITYPRNPTL